MPFQPADNCAEAVVRISVNGEVITMTFHFAHVGEYDQEDIDALASEMDSWADTFLKPLIADDTSYSGVEVRGLQSIVDLFAVDVTSAGPGEADASPMPNAVCIACKRVTGFTGRSARGRVYFPIHGVMLDTNENFITSTAATAIAAALEEVIDVGTANQWIHIVLSRQQDGVVLESAVGRAVTDYVFADLEIDTQRRRMGAK